MRENTIAVIAFNGISPFHLSVPCAVFGEDRTNDCVPKFELLVCAAEKGILKTTAGFTIETRHGLKDLAKASMVIVPSWRNPAELPPPRLLNALRKASQRGSQIVGLCLG
jgi:transcriptional regulator GlxA family with amidase domain